MSRRARAARHFPSSPSSSRGVRCAQALAAAIAAHRAGELEAARLGYTAVLEQQPENFDALNLLGVVAVQLGQPEVGETLIGLALRVKPRSHEALGNLAMALRAQGRDADAESALCLALEIAPGYVDGLRNLATLRQAQGRNEEAVALLSRALAGAPDHAVIRGNLGALMLAAGDAEGARPHLAHAVRLAPNDPNLLANLARADLETDRVDSGIEVCERALRLSPRHVPVLVTLSALERVRGRFDAAESHARAAVAVAPPDRGAQLNLATALIEMARYEPGAEILENLIEADPRDVEAHTSRAAVSLSCGRLDDAWKENVWRWRLSGVRAPHPPALPEWQGDAIGDGTLYVWPEQGIGDELLFASTIPDLARRVPNLVLGCDSRLVGVFARSFPTVRVVPADELNRVAAGAAPEDRQCSIVDLGPALRPTLASFPSRSGYLVPDPAGIADWRSWLASLGAGPKIGISWRSQNQRGERRLACTDLMQWAPLFGVRDVHFVCLQYDECSAEVAAAESRYGVRIHVPPKLDQRNDLDGVIALMRGLDIVISVATTVSTLAGGVGATTWQLARGVDWHAMGTGRSLWQPSVRQVYRQWDVTWDEVLAGVAHELQRFGSHPIATKAA